MMSITELEIRVYIQNIILSETESYAFSDFKSETDSDTCSCSYSYSYLDFA
ncbi:hypothetical protein LOK49_LG13G00080 [Camellia lanceoleosa]|uniref:Uncharacterized protein n=1 Tax=Camellia lanceoleosa TaxID=1840588 RepID=A0ACC0FMZ4_9ERIC|nr:hypothetical protein LOK49_LG13G00080 [Camellia lanceoleosa]